MIATRLVAVNTARIYEILIHKLSDVENKELEQAEFTATLQPASPLEKLLGGKVEIKSQQTIQRTGENKETMEIRYRLTDLTAGTYTLAETKAPIGLRQGPGKVQTYPSSTAIRPATPCPSSRWKMTRGTCCTRRDDPRPRNGRLQR